MTTDRTERDEPMVPIPSTDVVPVPSRERVPNCPDCRSGLYIRGTNVRLHYARCPQLPAERES